MPSALTHRNRIYQGASMAGGLLNLAGAFMLAATAGGIVSFDDIGLAVSYLVLTAAIPFMAVSLAMVRANKMLVLHFIYGLINLMALANYGGWPFFLVGLPMIGVTWVAARKFYGATPDNIPEVDAGEGDSRALARIEALMVTASVIGSTLMALEPQYLTPMLWGFGNGIGIAFFVVLRMWGGLFMLAGWIGSEALMVYGMNAGQGLVDLTGAVIIGLMTAGMILSAEISRMRTNEDA